METSIEINPTLKVMVQMDKYGHYIRIQRKCRWICLSKSLWKIINDKLNQLQKIGEVVFLTKSKRLEVISYKDHRYVSFIQQQPGSDFKNIINFNDAEWNTLLQNLQIINNALKDCDACHNLKTQIVLLENSQRVRESKLSKSKVTQLEEYNCSVENQQGMMCLYCGQEMMDDCHCHAYNCYMCEPQNFCSECYGITVYAAV